MSSGPNAPENVEASLTNWSPYEVPKVVWGLIEPYFEDKYKIEVAKSYPKVPVKKPTVCWRTFDRTPGPPGKSQAQGTGPSYAYYKDRDASGRIIEIHEQRHRTVYEYAVFADSNEVVDRLAWDMEQAILQATGVLQQRVPGFTLAFMQQVGDGSMIWRQQDDLIVRTLRFIANVPVRYERPVQELRYVAINTSIGREFTNTGRITRTSSSTSFYVPVATGERVVGILAVFRYENSRLVPLEQGVDYKVKTDSDNLLYIEWNDDYGVTPAVDSEFRVDYELAKLVKSSIT